MARNPQQSINFSGVDRSGENFRFGGYVDVLIDMNDLPAIVTDFNTSLGLVADGAYTSIGETSIVKLSNQKYSTDGQREERWLCSYQDNISLQIFQMEIPCRKASVKPPVNLDTVDLTVAPWVDFKTRFQALFVSPDGEAITLLEVRLVGRNV